MKDVVVLLSIDEDKESKDVVFLCSFESSRGEERCMWFADTSRISRRLCPVLSLSVQSVEEGCSTHLKEVAKLYGGLRFGC